MLRKVVVPSLFFIVMMQAGCSVLSHEAPTDDIDKAGALFFQRLGNEELDTIYNDSATDFKQNQTRQTVTDNLKQLIEKGKAVDFFRISMTFQGKGKSRIASPVFRVLSDRSKGELTLNFKDQGGEWKLIGFAYKPR